MKRVVLAEEAESSDVKKLRQTEEPVECKKEKISFTEWSGNIQSTSTSDVVLEEPKSELVSSTPEKSKLGNEDQQNSSATETEDVEKIFEEKIVEGKLGNEDQQNSSETVTEDVEKIFEEKIVEERWQLRPFNVKQRMNHLLSTGNMSDCTFIVGKDNKQEFKAHIVLMSMSSPHFEDLLSESTTVTITDVESDIFKQILEYIYIDYTNLWSLEKTQALYRASTKFQLPHLSGKAVEFLMEKMNLNSIWPIFEAAIDTQDLFLMDECSKFFKKNIAELLKHSKFRKVDPSVLYNLVEDDNLGVMETDLVNGVKQWASQRCTDIDLIPNVENKRAVLGSQVVQNLRFLALKKETFVKQIAFNKQKSDEGILTMDESYAILMNMVVPDSHPMPEGFTDNANPRSTAERLRLNRRIFNPLGTYYKQHHGGSYTNRLTVYANVSGKALTGTKNFTLELTVNRTICLHGIQIPTFYPTDPSSFPKDYEETYVVTIQNSSIPSKPIITSITWSGKVAYNSVMDIMFKDYIKLEKNLKYTILVYTSNTYYVNQKLCTVEEAGQVKFVFKDSVSVFAKSNTLDFGFISQLIYTPLALQ